MPPKRGGKRAASGAKKKTGAKKTQKATAEHKTGFLDLPPEIRNQIYHLALVRNMR